MEGPCEQQVLEHPKNPDLIDAAAPEFTFDSIAALNYLLQRPRRDAFCMPSIHRTQYPAPLMSLCAAETSEGPMNADETSKGSSTRTSRGSGCLSPNLSSVPRSVRYNPISVSSVARSSRERKRRSGKRDDFSDDDDDIAPAPTASDEVRLEEIRRELFDAEQRRRDELRDGYRRLKDALPVSNQKSRKVSLLDRATTRVKDLKMTLQQVQTRLMQAENETARLRDVNETLILGTAEQGDAAAAVAAVPQQQTSS